MFRVDPNKNKVSYNFITGEDSAPRQKLLAPPRGMVSEGVGEMFEVLRDANTKSGQTEAERQAKRREEEARKREAGYVRAKGEEGKNLEKVANKVEEGQAGGFKGKVR